MKRWHSFWARRYARKCWRKGELPPTEALCVWAVANDPRHLGSFLADVRAEMLLLEARGKP